MPSFDIVSEFDKQEVVNAIDQSGREIVNRYDFKNTNTTISLNENQINLLSTTEDRALAADQVMREKFSKRNVSIKFLADKKVEKTPSEIKFIFNLKSGINQEESKEITKLIKDKRIRDYVILPSLTFEPFDKMCIFANDKCVLLLGLSE